MTLYNGSAFGDLEELQPLTPSFPSVDLPKWRDNVVDSDKDSRPIHGSSSAAPLVSSAQPIYDESWREDACTHNSEGQDYPHNTPTVAWFNGLRTPVPFSANAAGIPFDKVSSSYIQVPIQSKSIFLRTRTLQRFHISRKTDGTQLHAAMETQNHLSSCYVSRINATTTQLSASLKISELL